MRVCKLDREQLKQVFQFITFLKFRNKLVANITVEQTNLATLYNEFAEEDRQLAEIGMNQYTEHLKNEDLA